MVCIGYVGECINQVWLMTPFSQESYGPKALKFQNLSLRGTLQYKGAADMSLKFLCTKFGALTLYRRGSVRQNVQKLTKISDIFI